MHLRGILRGYGYRLEGRAGLEGSTEYRHQGGGQDHTHQLRVSCNNTIIKEMNNYAILY